MRLRNRDGTPIDPVPFVVVVGLAFMLALSLGPLYGLAYGLPIWVGVVVSAVVFLVVAVGAYHRLVWTTSPETREVAIELRAERLFYLALILAVVIVALTLPLLL